MTDKVLGPIGVAAMEKRGLNPETAARLNIYTASKNAAGETVPDANGNILVFPVEEHGVVVNEKYRGPNKTFWQRPGGKRTFINADVLDDPSLYDGTNALTIVEGEPDMISAIDCGFPLTVSVPDGAPPAVDPTKALDPIDPAMESSGKFEFLYNNRDRLKKIKKFIIAVDNDPPGKRLADELVRRLSASRCYFVTYPEGCKDLNDVLMRDGVEAVAAVLANAKPYPLQGVYTLTDYPDQPPIETFSTGWETVDSLYRFFFACLVVITGLPGSGKSSWLAHFLVYLAETYGFRAAVFSPEMPVVPHLRDKFRTIVGRRSLEDMTKADLARVDKWLDANMVFIDHEVADDNDEDLTLDWLLERAADAVMRYGIRILVIDPWNELEHAMGRNQTQAQYLNSSIRRLKRFARRYNLCVFIIAHPTKDVMTKDGKTRLPSLYDIDGGAVWYNKPEIGIVIDRPNAHSDETHVHVRKVRFAPQTGRKGEARLRYDEATARYSLLSYDGAA